MKSSFLNKNACNIAFISDYLRFAVRKILGKCQLDWVTIGIRVTMGTRVTTDTGVTTGTSLTTGTRVTTDT